MAQPSDGADSQRQGHNGTVSTALTVLPPVSPSGDAARLPEQSLRHTTLPGNRKYLDSNQACSILLPPSPHITHMHAQLCQQVVSHWSKSVGSYVSTEGISPREWQAKHPTINAKPNRINPPKRITQIPHDTNTSCKPKHQPPTINITHLHIASALYNIDDLLYLR